MARAAGDNRLVASVRSGGLHEAADELHVLVVPCGLQPDDTKDAADNAGRPSERLQLRPRDADCGGSHCDFYCFAGGRRQKGGVGVRDSHNYYLGPTSLSNLTSRHLLEVYVGFHVIKKEG